MPSLSVAKSQVPRVEHSVSLSLVDTTFCPILGFPGLHFIIYKKKKNKKERMILLYTAIGRVQLVKFFQFTISFFFLVRENTSLVSHGRLGNKINGSWGQFLLCQHFLSKTLVP